MVPSPPSRSCGVSPPFPPSHAVTRSQHGAFPCDATARGDEELLIGPNGARRPKAGLSGFVAYMQRKDAEVAVKELDGLEWGGCAIRVGWSKMIRIPARPLYGKSAPDVENRPGAGLGG